MAKYNEFDFNKPITTRVKQLRKEVISAKPILCSERAMIITKVYQETEDEPYVKRRALSFKAILENMTQNIWPGELIIGSHGSNGRRSAPVFPEFAIEWLEEELDDMLEMREQDKFEVPDEVKRNLKSIFPYWKNKTNYKKYRALLPEETKKVRDAYMFTRDLFERNGYGHTVYQVEKILNIGIKGLKEETVSYLNKLDLTTSEGLEKKIFYESILICFDAVINYAKRYAQKALLLAESQTDKTRKKELLQIADVCNWVPENPARNTWDALQVISFMQIIIQTETSGDSVSPGRLDQYLYPFYKQDIASKTYTIGEIQELLDCFWLKLNEIVKVQDSESIHIHPGFPMTPNITAGGQKSNGDDATNEVSYLMLNAQKHIRMTNPQFTVRIHKDTPKDFLKRIGEIIKLGTGMPALFGDNGCYDAIKRAFPDMPMDRVRDYGVVGCVELAPKGFQARVNAGFLNVARIVDLSLNDGVDRLTGEQIGLKTGDVNAFKTFDDVMKAVRTQANYFVRHQVINGAVVDMIQREYTQHLFLSSLIEGCLENGKDLTWGGSLWGSTPILHVGFATAANSLSSVKKAVFDDKTLTLAEIKQTLDSDFAGKRGEEIQQLLIDMPKYGNDDDYADAIAKQTMTLMCDEIESHKDIDGRAYTSMILTLGGTVPHGWKTGATADGRKAGMPVSDSMSPSNTGSYEGPTAVLLSASKLEQDRILEGNVLNLKFSKTAISSTESQKKLMDLVYTYLTKLRGQEVQINVVDGETLRDAQVHPENYRDLTIRIAGYSARFIELAKELQDDIIDREEHDNL